MEETSFFGGTAYLGMPFNEKFKKLVFAGIDKYGVNFGASRNNKVTPDIFALAEAEAAHRCGAEDSIIVSSGYLSAQLVIQHYFGNHKLIYAPDTHPALWIGQPNLPQMSFTEWTEHTLKEVNSSEQAILLITNSLNNLFPEIYNFEWLKNILPGKQITLLVDDSHGIGITGKNGEGVYRRIPKLTIDTIVIASMAKALGVDAGVILASKKIITELRSSPIYAAASPPSPGFLYAYVNGGEIYREQLEKLRSNMKFFTSFIKELEGIDYLEGFPVYLFNDVTIGDYLTSKGILISSFAYPDPKGKTLNRVVLSSSHSKEELRKLATAFLGSTDQTIRNKGLAH